MRNRGICRAVVAIGVVTLVAVAPIAADEAKIVKGLTGDLGITDDQAVGGAKALLDVAKGNLGDEEFGQLLSGNAGLGDLMDGDKGSAKAKAKSKVGSVKGKIKGDGGSGEGLAALTGNADLIKQFTDLGMDAGMIEGFVDSLLDAVGGGGPGSGLLSPKTKLLRKGLGIL